MSMGCIEKYFEIRHNIMLADNVIKEIKLLCMCSGQAQTFVYELPDVAKIPGLAADEETGGTQQQTVEGGLSTADEKPHLHENEGLFPTRPCAAYGSAGKIHTTGALNLLGTYCNIPGSRASIQMQCLQGIGFERYIMIVYMYIVHTVQTEPFAYEVPVVTRTSALTPYKGISDAEPTKDGLLSVGKKPLPDDSHTYD